MQDFPSQPIVFVVNWPAGGGQDTIARLIAGWAAKRVDVPIVVSNVTGAAGANGVRRVARGKPDGYTVGIIGSSFVARAFLNRNATPLDGIDPRVFVGPDPAALEVRADAGIESVQEYVDKLKASPGNIANGNDPPGARPISSLRCLRGFSTSTSPRSLTRVMRRPWRRWSRARSNRQHCR